MLELLDFRLRSSFIPSNRDIDGLRMGTLTCQKQGPGATPHCVRLMAGQDVAGGFPPGAEGSYQLKKDLMAGCLISYQGNQQRSTPLMDTLISYQVAKVRTIINWGLGQACKVSQVSRMKVKQGLVAFSRYRVLIYLFTQPKW